MAASLSCKKKAKGRGGKQKAEGKGWWQQGPGLQSLFCPKPHTDMLCLPLIRPGNFCSFHSMFLSTANLIILHFSSQYFCQDEGQAGSAPCVNQLINAGI